jgi:tetratricopeptide (TPR) repeat protein
MNSQPDQVALLQKIKEFNALLSQQPDSDVFVPLTRCYLDLGLIDAAFEAVKKGLAEQPQHVDGLLLLAHLHGQRNEYDDAVAVYEQILSLDSQNHLAQLGLVDIDISQGFCSRAASKLDRLRREYSHDRTFVELEKRLEELRSHDDENDNDESAPVATTTIAELYVKQGLLEKAVSIYRQLCQQQPDNQDLAERLRKLESELNHQGNLQKTAGCSQVEILEQWLVAIDRRRRNV